MKKQLLWALMLMLAGFSSCQKDSFKPAATSNPAPAKVKTNSLDPQNFYADLVLLPRKAGENFDTYSAFFSGVNVIVTGSPSWNTVMYPTLLNGVPTAGAGVATADGQNAFISPIGTYGTSSKVIQDGDAFVIVQGQLGFFDASAFQRDLDDFNFAFDVFISTGASIPFIGDYIKDNYSTGGGVVTIPAKLIRVTTGSHWAVATIDYPAPKITSVPVVTIPSTEVIVQDPSNPHVSYYLYGKNGIFTGGSYAYDGNGTDTAIQISGTYYQVTPHTGLYHSHGTITRLDGTTFTFDLTADQT
ncbi:hypothetical protein ACFFGT_23820 [Mucilaginibacter angelicae]|uniref:DUF5689 domain-containing protein n=1 Tax=Mucilaginibacter angelicae TaxID=869718 RepID=A0ABV6LCQ6_9SPHI